MPSFHPDTGVIQAKFDPLGRYIAYRISGNGQYEYELRSLTDVELNIDNVIHHLGPMPLTQSKATELDWTDCWVFQATVPPSINCGGSPEQVMATTLILGR
jgi:hypothetical protein